MNWGFVFEFLGTDVPLQAAIWSLFALGVFVSYRILNIADLSVESVFPFSAILSIFFINNGVDPLLSLLLSVLLSIIIGLLNACLKVFLKIPSLLSGIIIMIGLYSINVVLCKGTISLDSERMTIIKYINYIFNNLIVSKIIVSLFVLAIVMVILYWFFGTELGLSLRAAGKNKVMSKAQGINTNSRYILGMLIATGIIGLAGALYGQVTTHVNTEDGRGSIVIGLAIVFLGEVIFGRKTFKLSLISIFIGGLIYWLIMDIITLIPGFDTNYTLLVQACFIALVVSIPLLKKYIKQFIKPKDPNNKNNINKKEKLLNKEN